MRAALLRERHSIAMSRRRPPPQMAWLWSLHRWRGHKSEPGLVRAAVHGVESCRPSLCFSTQQLLDFWNKRERLVLLVLSPCLSHACRSFWVVDLCFHLCFRHSRLVLRALSIVSIFVALSPCVFRFHAFASFERVHGALHFPVPDSVHLHFCSPLSSLFRQRLHVELFHGVRSPSPCCGAAADPNVPLHH